MRLGYTEFSFGYAFTENLIRSTSVAPQGAPIFPNLIQEAQLGYDVNINLPGLPLFFQYKLAELMRRGTAFEISKHHSAGLSIPFFRMPVMRRDLSDQHQLLINLERKYPRTVLYATPKLHDLDEFNEAYNAAIVHQRSVFFSPGDIGLLPDDKAHSVAYCDGLTFAYFYSEPRRIEARSYENVGHETQALFEQDRFRTLEYAARELRSSIRTLASPLMKATENTIAGRIRVRRSPEEAQPDTLHERERVIEDILVAREMARVDLGVDILIAQPRA
jgi:hypothetical protein